jgi:thiamine-monophosphate kinase
MSIDDLGEFGLINRLRQRLSHHFAKPDVLVGPGDDAAVLAPPSPGHSLVFTTDALVEGVHFRLAWSSGSDLGWKLVAINVSDIAAMSARPLFAAISIALSEKVDLPWFDAFTDGVDEAAREYQLRPVGGDIVRSPGPLFVCLSAVGEVDPSKMLLRSGAKPGHILMVTGNLGASGAGLRALQQGRSHDPDLMPAVQAHLRPRPRLAAAQALGGLASAGLDISDGLAGDAMRLAEESRVAVRLEIARLPTAPACLKAAEKLGFDPIEMALRGGEDYELLFSVEPGRLDNVNRALAESATPAAAIGSIHEGEPSVIAAWPDGREEKIPGGYDHFRATEK